MSFARGAQARQQGGVYQGGQYSGTAAVVQQPSAIRTTDSEISSIVERLSSPQLTDLSQIQNLIQLGQSKLSTWQRELQRDPDAARKRPALTRLTQAFTDATRQAQRRAQEHDRMLRDNAMFETDDFMQDMVSPGTANNNVGRQNGGNTMDMNSNATGMDFGSNGTGSNNTDSDLFPGMHNRRSSEMMNPADQGLQRSLQNYAKSNASSQQQHPIQGNDIRQERILVQMQGVQSLFEDLGQIVQGQQNFVQSMDAHTRYARDEIDRANAELMTMEQRKQQQREQQKKIILGIFCAILFLWLIGAFSSKSK